MREYHLNGAEMTDKNTTHEYLQRVLDLPNYYGGNLDALWDCLVSDFSEKTILISNLPAMLKNLGDYGDTILQLLMEAAAENNNIRIIMEDDPA